MPGRDDLAIANHHYRPLREVVCEKTAPNFHSPLPKRSSFSFSPPLEKDCIRTRLLHQIHDRTKVGIKQPAVGPTRNAVSHLRENIADDTGAAFFRFL